MSNQRNGDAGYRCGSRLNPWIIEAQIGQQINISLLDFGQQSRRSRSNDDISNKPSVAEIKGQTQEACAVQYGYIMEKAAAAGTVRNMSVCSGYGDLQRNRFVYQSRGSSVEIVFSSSNFTSDSQHKLLFGFEGYILPYMFVFILYLYNTIPFFINSVLYFNILSAKPTMCSLCYRNVSTHYSAVT